MRMLYEGQHDKFGQNCLHDAINAVQPDVVITSLDAWMISYLAHPERDPIVSKNDTAMQILSRDTRNFQHIAYFPLDGLVQGKHLPRSMDETIAGFDIPVTYSQFARNGVLRDTGLEIPFIPISHDTNVYCPGDRAASRRVLNLPQDKFIMGMVATNQYRKLWGEFIEAASRVCKRHSDALILPWTTWDMQICGGFDIADLIYRYDVPAQTINPGNVVGRLQHAHMAHLYRSLDVTVLTTVGEGAGLPPIRSRACGTPALVSANTSNIEFTVDHFEQVPLAGRHLDNGSNLERYSTNVDALEERLEYLYKHRSFRDDLGAKGAEFTNAHFSNEAINPMWDAILEKVQS